MVLVVNTLVGVDPIGLTPGKLESVMESNVSLITEDEFEVMLNNGDLDMEYSEYIMDNALIGNGDMLINAMESGNYYEGFKEYFLDQYKVA